MKLYQSNTDLAPIAHKMTTSRLASEILETISRELADMFKASLACIWLPNPDELYKNDQHGGICSTHEHRFYLNLSSDLRPMHGANRPNLPPSETWLAWISANAEPIISNNLAADERIADSGYAHGYGFQSFLGYPLRFREERLGAMALFSRYQLPHRAEKQITGLANMASIAIQNARLMCEVRTLKHQLEGETFDLMEDITLNHDHDNIIGRSAPLKRILAKVEQVAPTDTTVLILGETGTGKELIARAIHASSPRRNQPLVKVDCAALPADLIESELFGHEKGAFTTALSLQPGRFEIADGATIFLDEIGELPLGLQSKLLRVLQEGEYERLGNPRTLKTDVRVIAASNRNLEQEVQKNRFRKDIYYRLSVFPITVPPLRERPGDVPLLAAFFTHKFSQRMGKDIRTIPAGIQKVLERYSWPGNVRELENIIERAVINSQGPSLQLAEPLMTPLAEDLSRKRRASLKTVERDHILHVLDQTRWRIEGAQGAAEILNLNPSTLRSRMRRIGLKRPSVIFNGSVESQGRAT